MGGRELGAHHFGDVTVDASQALAAVRHIVRRAGQDPAELLELLDVLGLPTTRRALNALKARAAIDEAARKQRTKETP
jgi:hypothetical protein